MVPDTKGSDDQAASAMRLASSWILGTKKDTHLICSKAPWCAFGPPRYLSLSLTHTHTHILTGQ